MNENELASSKHQEHEVTTSELTEPEKAAWQVAVDRGLAITATDLRRLLAEYTASLLISAAAKRWEQLANGK